MFLEFGIFLFDLLNSFGQFLISGKEIGAYFFEFLFELGILLVKVVPFNLKEGFFKFGFEEEHFLDSDFFLKNLVFFLQAEMQLILGPERLFILGSFFDEKLFILIIFKMILSLTTERHPSLQF